MATDSYGRWPQLDAIFAAALDVEPAERPALLDRSCASDPELRWELERLLEAAGASADFLEDRELLLRPLAQAEDDLAPPRPAIGDRIGAYRLVREIGRGGMGIVYLAERADAQFEQRVALKLLAGWLGTPGELRRFQRERQILARLQHPHIARLLDGGVTADGRPYFVMEYIDGTAIDRYCDERQLEIRRRLELFLDLCGAVAFAHRNLVVHRDIKPGNVLVTAEGTARLLDFGIARLLQEEGAEGPTLVTRTGLHPMTPEYASPEMLRGERAGTASDVYQLGILLYQLLTGRPPHRSRSRSPVEIERALGTTDPERPSSIVVRAVRESDAELIPDRVARARSTTPERLRRRLRGDLDNIVLTALRHEPERRYASVERLADDVRRHLEGHPVHARRDTLLYRSSRFVGRHRVGVGTGALVSLLLVGSALAMARAARRTARERDKAEQVTHFIVDLFERSEPGATLGDSLSFRRVLQEGAQRARAELRDQPEVRARLLRVIGGVYRKRGLYGEARPLFEEAIRIQRRVLAPDDTELLASIGELGVLFMDLRQPAAAEPLFREALRIARARRGPADSAVALETNNLAYALHVQGRLVQAESLYRAALDLYRGIPGPDSNYPVALSNLGWILMNRGEYARADSAIGTALTVRRALHPPGDPRVANSLSALAYLRNLEERYGEGESLAREALRSRRAVYGEYHPLVADALATLAWSLAGLRRLDEADSLYRESLAVLARTLGEETRDAALVLSRLGVALAQQGRFAEAEGVSRRALAIYTRRFGPGNPTTVAAATNLASVLERAGRVEEAEPLYRDGLRSLRAAWPGDHPETARSLAALGRMQLARGQAAAAAPQLREALAMMQRTLPHARATIARTQASLGEALVALHGYAEAEPLLRDAHGALRRLLGADDPDTRRTRATLLRLYAETGRPLPEVLRSPG